jgi:hypothetical protein
LRRIFEQAEGRAQRAMWESCPKLGDESEMGLVLLQALFIGLSRSFDGYSKVDELGISRRQGS